MKSKEMESNLNFELDLQNFDSKYITIDYDYIKNDDKVKKILELDPEAEIEIDSFKGVLNWHLNFNSNKNGIESTSITVDPATITVIGRIDYAENEQANINREFSSYNFSVNVDLTEIEVEMDKNSFKYGSLYPDSLDIYDSGTAKLTF